jgi:hypothetical protein
LTRQLCHGDSFDGSNVYRHLGKLDIAEQLAASSVRQWRVEGKVPP